VVKKMRRRFPVFALLHRRGAAIGVGIALPVCAALLAAWGCSEPAHDDVHAGLDCDAGAAYTTWIIDTYEPGSQTFFLTSADGGGWYSYQDPTPGGVATVTNQPIENGGRCGSLYAAVLTSTGHHDYGSGFGDTPGAYNLQLPLDATGYEGITFWARNPGETTKGVTLSIDDELSSAPNNNMNPDGGCMVVNLPDGGFSLDAGDAGPSIPPPGACGNSFTYPMLTTSDWKLFTIPFSAFQQNPRPNRAQGGFDPSTFTYFRVVIPKEATVQLWIDDLGFYKTNDAGGSP
jgi:hypothetical protein